MADKSDANRKAAARVLDFWFAQGNDEHWFKSSAAFDKAVREALADDQERAAAGAYDSWRETAEGCLALILLFDQVPRNLFRDDPRAFATDARARAVARHAIAEGFDRKEWLEWAVKHREVIARFGRFPHRNAALGRASSAAEKEFLARPGSSF